MCKPLKSFSKKLFLNNFLIIFLILINLLQTQQQQQNNQNHHKQHVQHVQQQKHHNINRKLNHHHQHFTDISESNNLQHKNLIKRDTTEITNKQDIKFPDNCNGFNLLDDQPKQIEDATFKKCCQHDEIFQFDGKDYVCVKKLTPTNNLNTKIIYVKLFEKCIDDLERNHTLNITIENKSKCDSGIIYNTNDGDKMYVIQNGSLLIIDHAYEFYDLYNDFCIEDNLNNNNTIAIVCDKNNEPINRVTVINGTNETIINENKLINKPFPATCSGFPVLNEQPIKSLTTKLNKCCPNGQSFTFDGHNLVCQIDTIINNLTFPTIEAKFFTGCIEDLENNLTLNITVTKKCDGGILYNSSDDDQIYVIQNGSLLTIDPNYTYYDLYNEYCIEYSGNSLIAVVCDYPKSASINLSQWQSYATAICMLLSVPCLLITAFLHLIIKKLRNLHGETLACHSICLACGFGLLAIVQFTHNTTMFLGYLIQFFILACFLWLMVMCIDICLHVWIYLPQNRDIEARKLLRFIVYFAISMLIPLILVLVTHSSGISGMPSYYMKGMTDASKLSQRYFIPPICIILVITTILFISMYYGFRKLNAINSLTYIIKKRMKSQNIERNSEMKFMNSTAMEEVKRTAKSSLWLFSIMTINWIFEIISFYVHGLDEVLIIFDILNALQGILIFIIFVCLPHYSKIIKKWWIDRGQYKTETEMETLNGNGNK